MSPLHLLKISRAWISTNTFFFSFYEIANHQYLGSFITLILFLYECSFYEQMWILCILNSTSTLLYTSVLSEKNSHRWFTFVSVLIQNVCIHSFSQSLKNSILIRHFTETFTIELSNKVNIFKIIFTLLTPVPCCHSSFCYRFVFYYRFKC